MRVLATLVALLLSGCLLDKSNIPDVVGPGVEVQGSISYGCPEAARDSIAPPDSMDVVYLTTTKQLRLTLFDYTAVGFNNTWTLNVGMDDGTEGGSKPMYGNVGCASTAIYDWYVAMNDFRYFPNCPCPQWWWYWFAATPPDTVDRSNPVNVVTTQEGSNLVVTIDADKMPDFTNRQYWVTLVIIRTVCCSSPPTWGHRPAWSFSGVVSPGSSLAVAQ